MLCKPGSRPVRKILEPCSRCAPWRGLWHSLAFLGSLLAGLACSPTPASTLRVGTLARVAHAPLHLARGLGYLEGIRVKLVDMPEPAASMEGLRMGLLDGAALRLDEALVLLHEGVDLRVAAVLATSRGGEALLVRPGVKGLEGLRGLRIGTSGTPVAHYFLTRALQAGDLHPTEVQWVTLDEAGLEAAFGRGGVDGLVVQGDLRRKLLLQGASSLFDSTRIPNEIFEVLVVRSSLPQAKRALLDHLEKGWLRTLDDLRYRSQEVIPPMAARLGMTPESFSEHLKDLALPDRVSLPGLRSNRLREPARRLAESMFHHRQLPTLVDAGRLTLGLD